MQLLINSVDRSNGSEWLPDWLAEHGLEGKERRARDLRETLRALTLANNGVPLGSAALTRFNRALRRLSFAIDDTQSPRVGAEEDALDQLVAIVFEAMLDGSWPRMKSCRNCCWCFYDYSPNVSATWCSMQICGNRQKTRAYRRRKR